MILLFLQVILAVAPSHAQAREMHLVIEDGLMTLQSDNAPLSNIIDGIGRQAGIEIKSLVPLEEGITANVSRIPVDDGLSRLIRNYNYALGFEGPGNADGRVTSLFILSRTGNIQTSIVWREKEETDSPVTHDVIAKDRMQQPLLPDHLPGTPDDYDPMKSHTAIDPLARLELPNQDISVSGHGFLP